VTSLTQVIATFSEQIGMLEQQVDASFRRHTAATIYLSQRGLGDVLAARLLGEFSDGPHRYASANSRKNYAPTSPITRTPGKRAAVLARYARNDRPADAIHRWAFASLRASPGARRHYDQLRGRGKTHSAALRQLGNRLAGILHGCARLQRDAGVCWVGTVRPAMVDLICPTSRSACGGGRRWAVWLC
jgi:hypothetical protein